MSFTLLRSGQKSYGGEQQRGVSKDATLLMRHRCADVSKDALSILHLLKRNRSHVLKRNRSTEWGFWYFWHDTVLSRYKAVPFLLLTKCFFDKSGRGPLEPWRPSPMTPFMSVFFLFLCLFFSFFWCPAFFNFFSFLQMRKGNLCMLAILSTGQGCWKQSGETWGFSIGQQDVTRSCMRLPLEKC